MSVTSNNIVSLAAVAETAHSSAATIPDNGVGSFISVLFGESDLAIGHWPFPASVDHPTEALVGASAPPSWDAVGLSITGRAHRVDTGSVTSVRSTVLVDRSGTFASLIEDAGGPVQTIAEPPEGVLADALRRVLGLPTPPARVPVGYCVESSWLDAIAGVAFAAPGLLTRWQDLAELHPLGAARPHNPDPDELADRVRALNAESNWSRMLRLWARDAAVAEIRPPDTTAVAAAEWFDAGSFARWSMRNLPVAEDLLPAVLEVLPADRAAGLLRALVTVGLGPAELR